jgi:hypothetical protein
LRVKFAKNLFGKDYAQCVVIKGRIGVEYSVMGYALSFCELNLCSILKAFLKSKKADKIFDFTSLKLYEFNFLYY